MSAQASKRGEDAGPPTIRAVSAARTRPRSAAGSTPAGEFVGGTVWLWSRRRCARSVDVLFVDEAGQFSLANASRSPGAATLVLLGDPQQLDQPLQGSHPPGAERSALGHLLGDGAEMPPTAGCSSSDTWRLHPDICAFTSEVFYGASSSPSRPRASRRSEAGAICRRHRPAWLPGPRSAPHETPDEADAVAALVRDLLDERHDVDHAHGDAQPVELEDILDRRAVQRPRRRDPSARCRPRGARRHGRQVPGPGGPDLHLLDGDVVGGGRAARDGVPVLAATGSTSRLARPLRGDRRRVTDLFRVRAHARTRCTSRTPCAGSWSSPASRRFGQGGRSSGSDPGRRLTRRRATYADSDQLASTPTPRGPARRPRPRPAGRAHRRCGRPSRHPDRRSRTASSPR